MADPTVVLVHGAFADASSWRRLDAELAGADNVVGLVYVAGFAPDEGEDLGALQSKFPTSRCSSRAAW